MDLQWNRIRALDGSQQTGFEELCAQLARTETPNGAKFVRKGRPDAGVECFCTLEDGGDVFDGKAEDPYLGIDPGAEPRNGAVSLRWETRFPGQHYVAVSGQGGSSYTVVITEEER